MGTKGGQVIEAVTETPGGVFVREFRLVVLGGVIGLGLGRMSFSPHPVETPRAAAVEKPRIEIGLDVNGFPLFMAVLDPGMPPASWPITTFDEKTAKQNVYRLWMRELR